MTKKELIATTIIGVVAVSLLAFFWPRPGSVDLGGSEHEMLSDTMRRSTPRRARPPVRKRVEQMPSLQEIKKASGELVRQFELVRDSVMQAVRQDKLEEVEPYQGEVPLPGEAVIVRIEFVYNGKPTCDRKNGRTRISIAGMVSPDFHNTENKDPDYDLLASVLTAMRIRKQADSGEGLIVELQPMAFIPFEDIRRVVEAAGRARAAEIRLIQTPLPY